MNGLFSHNHLASLFFSALLLSLWLTPLAIRFSFRIDAVDRPDGRKMHENAVSRLGGLAMVAGVVIPLLIFGKVDRLLAGFLAGGLVVSVTGFLDDVFRIRPFVKFIGEILGAGTFLIVGGISLAGFGDFLGVGDVRFGALAPFVTIFCMVGVMNALNLSDGLDGLAGGVAAIACFFLGVFAYMAGNWLPLYILLALFGAVLGFLRYNTYPATLFMGDTGSLLLGYSLSAVAVMMAKDGQGAGSYSPATVAAVLALPIIDTLLVMLRRMRHGGSPFSPDRTHLHHRLLELGMPHTAVVPVLYVSSAGFGFQAWLLRSHPEWVQFAAVLALGGIVYGSIFLLQRSGYRWEDLNGRGYLFSPSRVNRRISSWLERSVVPAGWVIAIGLFFPTVMLVSVPLSVGMIAIGMVGFVAVLFPWKSQGIRSSVCFGLVYAACVCLLGILQFSPGAPRWIPGYLAALAAVALFWVLLKMRYRDQMDVIFLSAYEMLLIGLSIAIPFVLAPAMGIGEGFRRTMLTVCMESVSLLLAFKILIRNRPARNHLIAAAFLAALLFIGVRGVVGPRMFEARAPGDRAAVERMGIMLSPTAVSPPFLPQGGSLSPSPPHTSSLPSR